MSHDEVSQATLSQGLAKPTTVADDGNHGEKGGVV